MTAKLWLPLAILLPLAGCRDAAAPVDPQDVVGPELSKAAWSRQIPILQQSRTAPPLETYQVSFWAYRGQASTVTVNYQPVSGQSVGQPFLRLDISKNGLKAGAGGKSLKRGDSVAVTLTIDPVRFSVEFEPSGVLFSKNLPANLTIWYENANPDLNDDGVVDATDQALEQQLAFWYHAVKQHAWSRLSSTNDTTQESVSTALYHFSQYAICW